MGRPDGSWFWVVEPDGSAPGSIRTPDGRFLTRRGHGTPTRAIVRDRSGAALPVATLLRTAAALPESPVPWDVHLGPAGTEHVREGRRLTLDGPWIAAQPTRHPVNAALGALADAGRSLRVLGPTPRAEPTLEALRAAGPPARRVLFFESLMNTDMPHNDGELSQGVLHMASTLTGTGTEVVLANVKMSITDRTRRHVGLDSLDRALERGPIELVCITLLEGYWEGVVELIATLRRLGCRAHVAVGGVMASLAPEASAAHLPDVSFVCRGAGEYFVPRLAQILGAGASIDRALDEAQLEALLSMRGLVAIDRAARTLVSACSSETVSVEDLDAVDLDLDLLEPRHLVHGVEISTARGCIHKCTFCSILGRQSYQARSAAGVLALLERYEGRFRALFGDDVPASAHRLHISDDDFACDKERASSFLRALPGTKFRLSSFQVSVADLCRRVDGVLLPEPDPAIVDAIVPECFADARAPIPSRDYVSDHRSRRWSAYLAIGVETFAEAELRRLGKGYRLEHVREVVRVLARKRIHLDAYFIASNAETDIDDLIASVEEVCRLKIRHPEHFHVRFPIVPRLVSYGTSASHRRMIQRGEGAKMVIRAHASVPSHPEIDYTFVEHDVSADPRVEEVVAAGFFTDARRYTASLEAIAAVVHAHRGRAEDPEARRADARVLRRLDDLPRRLAFDALREARSTAAGGPLDRDAEQQVLASAEAILGPAAAWVRAFRSFLDAHTPCVVIGAGAAEQPASADTLRQATELLLSSERVELALRVRDAPLPRAELSAELENAARCAAERGRRLRVLMRPDEPALDAELVTRLGRHGAVVEVYLEDVSAARTHPARPPVPAVLAIAPGRAAEVARDLFSAVELGHETIRLELAPNERWSTGARSALAADLLTIGEELRRRWSRGARVELTNLEAGRTVDPRREIGVTWDATIATGGRVRARLEDCTNIDRHCLDDHEDGEAVGERSRDAARVLASFVSWMRSGRHGPDAPALARHEDALPR